MISREGSLICDRCGGPDPRYRRRDEVHDGSPSLYCQSCVERCIAEALGEATAALELIEAATLKARRAWLKDSEISEAMRLVLAADEHAPSYDSPTLQAVPHRDVLREREYSVYDAEEVTA